MINNVVLVSGAQQSDSVIHIHVSILSQILFPFRLSQSIEQSSLCSTVPIHFKASCWPSKAFPQTCSFCPCQGFMEPLLNTTGPAGDSQAPYHVLDQLLVAIASLPHFFPSSLTLYAPATQDCLHPPISCPYTFGHSVSSTRIDHPDFFT